MTDQSTYERLKKKVAYLFQCQDEFEKTKSRQAARKYFAVRGELVKEVGKVTEVEQANFEWLAK